MEERKLEKSIGGAPEVFKDLSRINVLFSRSWRVTEDF